MGFVFETEPLEEAYKGRHRLKCAPAHLRLAATEE